MSSSAPSALPCAAGTPFELACSESMAVSIFLKILAGLPAATWKGGTSYEGWGENFNDKTSDRLGRPDCYLRCHTPRPNRTALPNPHPRKDDRVPTKPAVPSHVDLLAELRAFSAVPQGGVERGLGRLLRVQRRRVSHPLPVSALAGVKGWDPQLCCSAVRKQMVDDLGHVMQKGMWLAGSTGHGLGTAYSLHNCTMRRRDTSSDLLKTSQTRLQRFLAAMSPGTKVDTAHHAKLCPIPERRGAYCGTCKRAEDKANWVKSGQEKNRWKSLDIYQVVEGNKLMEWKDWENSQRDPEIT
jgi:hypothetical protein